MLGTTIIKNALRLLKPLQFDFKTLIEKISHRNDKEELGEIRLVINLRLFSKWLLFVWSESVIHTTRREK